MNSHDLRMLKHVLWRETLRAACRLRRSGPITEQPLHLAALTTLNQQISAGTVAQLYQCRRTAGDRQLCIRHLRDFITQNQPATAAA